MMWTPYTQRNTTPQGASRLTRWLPVLALISCLCTLATISILWFTRPRPPVASLEKARVALAAASTAEAQTYAPRLWAQAERYWNYTLRAFREQRRQWFFLRDFAEAERLAQQTEALAMRARERAIAVRDSLTLVTEGLAKTAQQQIELYRTTYRDLPGNTQFRERAVRSELLLHEAQHARARGDLVRAGQRLREAKEAIEAAGNGSASAIRAYFANVPTWRQWAQETISYSNENHCSVIIIDKFAHLCRVYQNGKVAAEFPVELGANWVGHKQRRGDNATPEGHYLVTRKKSGRSTIYYKALVLNYPNENDMREFRVKKERGLLPPGAQIGGLIEIHGEGGKGFDWTNGCVALTNKDMDRLYSMVDVGTRVTIVGSLQSWEAFFGNHQGVLGTK